MLRCRFLLEIKTKILDLLALLVSKNAKRSPLYGLNAFVVRAFTCGF